jgi:hypothetical protein
MAKQHYASDPVVVTIQLGQSVSIQFAETDGEITVSYGARIDDAVTVEADMPDSYGRTGIIYREDFGVRPGDTIAADDLHIPSVEDIVEVMTKPKTCTLCGGKRTL